MLECRCRVVGSPGEIELLHVSERLLQAVGIFLVDGDSGAQAPVEIGRHCHVAQLGEAAADAFDVVIDSEYLLAHDQPRPGSSCGQHEIASEAASVMGEDLLGATDRHDLLIAPVGLRKQHHASTPFVSRKRAPDFAVFGASVGIYQNCRGG